MDDTTVSMSVQPQVRGTKTAEAEFPLENRKPAKVQRSMSIKKY